MTKTSLKLFLPIFILAALFITSCSDEDGSISEQEVENYTEDAVFNLQKRAKCGVRGCFEFMFPITIVFPDGAEAEVESYEELRERIKGWKEENPDAETKPALQYPLDLLTDEGEIVTVNDREELAALVKECVREFVDKHPRLNNSCFRIAFPINIEVPNGDTISVDNRLEFKRFLRRWHASNPDAVDKPKIVFPITVVIKEDGSEMVIESKEDLQALKEECRG